MQNQPWFKEWFNSPYYHHLYFKRDEKEAAIFIDKLIDHLQPTPAAIMLDVACGKGRHAIQLASKGFNVTGIDLSEDSIKEAMQFERENLHFYLQDMRLPFRSNYFDFAFNFFTSFGYFLTRSEHDEAIKTIAVSLKNTGCFVLDYLNVAFTENHLVKESEKEIEGINFSITKWFDDTHFYKKIIVEEKALQVTETYQEKVAKFTLQDFTAMFARQGLNIEAVYGDYNFGEYDKINSPRLIMIAKKSTV